MSAMTACQHPLDARTTAVSIWPDITPHFTGSGRMDRLYGPDGKAQFKRWGWFWKVPLFEFRQGKPPLTFHDYDGSNYQPDNHFISDGGSIPPPLWGLPFFTLNPMAGPKSYPPHDSAFKYRGLYVRRRGEAFYRFRLLPRKFLNDLLKRMIEAEGGTTVERGSVRLGVGLGSWLAWDEKAQAQARERDGIVVAG